LDFGLRKVFTRKILIIAERSVLQNQYGGRIPAGVDLVILPKKTTQKIESLPLILRPACIDYRGGVKHYPSELGGCVISREEIVNRANRIKSMPSIQKYGVINEYQEMSEGGSACGIREEYYSGWSNQDFLDVLNLVEEDEG
jgi:hypothetical protein